MSQYMVQIDQKGVGSEVPDNAVTMTIDNLMDVAPSFRLLVDTVLGFGGVGTRISIVKVSDEKPNKTDMERALEKFRNTPTIHLTGGAVNADS